VALAAVAQVRNGHRETNTEKVDTGRWLSEGRGSLLRWRDKSW